MEVGGALARESVQSGDATMREAAGIRVMWSIDTGGRDRIPLSAMTSGLLGVVGSGCFRDRSACPAGKNL
jgi:hypothetical protein